MGGKLTTVTSIELRARDKSIWGSSYIVQDANQATLPVQNDSVHRREPPIMFLVSQLKSLDVENDELQGESKCCKQSSICTYLRNLPCSGVTYEEDSHRVVETSYLQGCPLFKLVALSAKRAPPQSAECLRPVYHKSAT